MKRIVEPTPADPDSPTGLRSHVVWIDWGVHLRTRSLCARLGVDLEEIVVRGGRIRRYWGSIRRTVAVLRARRPDVVLATNPSLVLGYLLLLLRRPLGFRVVSDAHYVGVEALRGGSLVQFLLDQHNRRADLVVVTNEPHRRRIEALGGNAFVCPDPLPDLDGSGPAAELDERSVFLICSFDADEPFREAFTAFRSLEPEGYRLFVSGNPAKGGVAAEEYPWVRFLGFVPTATYEEYLRGAALIMDLTTLENCLVCGAYEALRLHRPLLLSDTTALRGYFGDACAYTRNDAEAIAAAVRAAHADRGALESRSRAWVTRNERDMEQTMIELSDAISDLARGEAR